MVERRIEVVSYHHLIRLYINETAQDTDNVLEMLQKVLIIGKIKAEIFAKIVGSHMEENKYEKRGYLNEDYRLFFLEDIVKKEVEYHYHDFDKILIFLKGNIDYTIEGKTYSLLPGDVVLVPRGAVHKVSHRESETQSAYVRLVIYLSTDYLTKYEEGGYTLRHCFEIASEKHRYVFRNDKKSGTKRLPDGKGFIDGLSEGGMMPKLRQENLLLHYLIQFNDVIHTDQELYVDTKHFNKKIIELIQYINNHLTQELSIEQLSEQMFLSKYHMMRQFKNETGYTIANYINQKRLLLAQEKIKAGEPVTKVCYDCGFRDYSTFVRAYKKRFLVLPSKEAR